MIYAQEAGYQNLAFSANQATTGTAEGIADTIGANYLSVIFLLGSQASATSKPQVLKLQESDSTEATSFVDIPEMVGDGPEGFTIPDANTIRDQALHLGMRMNGRKRYVRAQCQPGGSAQDVAIVAQLSEGPTEDLHRSSDLSYFA